MLNMYLYLQFLISNGYKSKNEESGDEEMSGSSGTHILFGKYVLIEHVNENFATGCQTQNP